MRTWKHAGARLAVETWGAGAVRAVLLHEGLGSIALWKGFPEALAGRVGGRVLAYDRRGHGASDPLDAPRRPDFMHREAEVLAAFLEAEGAGDAVLVGHSDGASIALLHAARRPVRGLALMAPHVFVESLSLASIRDARERFAGTDLCGFQPGVMVFARFANLAGFPFQPFNGFASVLVQTAFTVDIAGQLIDARAQRSAVRDGLALRDDRERNGDALARGGSAQDPGASADLAALLPDAAVGPHAAHDVVAVGEDRGR